MINATPPVFVDSPLIRLLTYKIQNDPYSNIIFTCLTMLSLHNFTVLLINLLNKTLKQNHSPNPIDFHTITKY